MEMLSKAPTEPVKHWQYIEIIGYFQVILSINISLINCPRQKSAISKLPILIEMHSFQLAEDMSIKRPSMDD